MANLKNTNRRKRKYANQAARTERNRASKKARAERHQTYLKDRTMALQGKRAIARTGEGTFEGEITDIIWDGPDHPKNKGSKRKSGQFLEITRGTETRVRSRHRIKVK